jgi:succinate---hydroxymethylglutarate CoA-transferase
MGHLRLVPYGGFETRGCGWLFISANNNGRWQALWEKLGDQDLAADERFSSNDGRVKYRAEPIEAVQRRLEEKTLDEELGVCKGSELPYGPVYNIQRAIDHPQTEARNMVESRDFEAATEGALKLLDLFPSFTRPGKVEALDG